MKIGRLRGALRALLGCAFVVAALPLAAAPKPAVPEPAAKAAEQKAPPADPLGRETPYGTVMGFLRAAEKNDLELAASYLEGRQSARQKIELARDLEVVLNRGLRIGPDDLSKSPEGHLPDAPSTYLEKIGTASYADKHLDIVLRRRTAPEGQLIWVFASETLLGVGAAAEELAEPWAEAIWPESFREVRVLSVPVYRILSLLVGLPIMLGLAWLLMRGLLRLLRPVVLRYSAEQGERALARLKWLLLLLIFSILARIAAAEGITVTGRILYTSVANVLMAVAASWMLVRITRMVARSKVEALRRSSVPGRIAVVELSTWLLLSVWAIGGLFLILRSLDIELTAAIAGLGVGGIAIAFAAQKTIENLFGTVMVVADEAIHVGDYCQAGTVEGRVESIGLRSTRIRTPDRTLVSIPNGQLAGMSIGNVARRDKFLFKHNIRLAYGTTAEQLRQVLSGIREMMSEHRGLEPATVRTRLIRFGDASLEIEAFAYVSTRELEVFLEIQENLLLRIMDIVEASGAAVAAPSNSSAGPASLGPVSKARETAPGEKKGDGKS